MDADIDECEGGSHDCSQICVNTPGSYYCNCQRGFQLVNGTECEGMKGNVTIRDITTDGTKNNLVN